MPPLVPNPLWRVWYCSPRCLLHFPQHACPTSQSDYRFLASEDFTRSWGESWPALPRGIKLCVPRRLVGQGAQGQPAQPADKPRAHRWPAAVLLGRERQAGRCARAMADCGRRDDNGSNRRRGARYLRLPSPSRFRSAGGARAVLLAGDRRGHEGLHHAFRRHAFQVRHKPHTRGAAPTRCPPPQLHAHTPPPPLSRS